MTLDTFKSQSVIQSNSFVLEAEINVVKKYGYTCLLSVNNESDEIKCEYNITFLGKSPASQNFIFLIDRISPVFINEMEPDTLVDELAFKLGQVLYPLRLEISTIGEMKELNNHNEILKRWPALKEDLLDYYEGKEVNKYINQTEQTIYSAELLFDSLKHDWFLTSYFTPVYDSYNAKFQKEQFLYMPISECEIPLQYHTFWNMSKEVNEHNEIEVTIKGFLKEDRCKLDLEQQSNIPYYRLLDSSEEDAKGLYTAEYTFSKGRKVMQQALITCDLQLEEPLKVEVRIFNITEQIEQPINNYTKGFEIIDFAKGSKSGFWSKFFKS